MSKKFTAIAVSIVFLVSAASLLAEEKGDEEKVPALQEELQQELENRQPDDLEQTPQPAEPEQRQTARRRIRARRNEQLEIDAVQRRNRADQQQPPVHQRLRRIVQLQNRWFNALKEAYREGDMDRVGRLIDRMDQFRKQVRNRTESAQEMRPLERQRHRADQDYQPQGRMRNLRTQRRGRGPVDEAPAFRRQLRQERRPRFRMQDMPEYQLQRPAAPLHQGYCENCNCEKCRQLRAGQQRRLQRPEAEGRGPDRFGPYEEEGFQQRRLRQQRGWQQQQGQPKKNIQENEELDFDWDW
jgi:hypothetical protein